ncbi:TonB-dependent receptor [Spongiibacter taiwanensis]|uniref:TonB-dependent receptor n=1 Tax=Spongiibacter taiwanensis TaxID=1748242 RepID=UPI002034FA5E|nr:TonB-dependent receptor [Spongiibacter taiwanensis]USA42774.1 TonB-dependent receptor [Spongiibacter taiwanensis]
MKKMVTLFALLATSSYTHGQDAKAKPANRLIEEVVVLAQKREENIQDVPISLAAFSAQALDAKGIDDPVGLAQFTPGLTYGQSVNFAVVYIRGVGTDAFLPDSDPSVATYIDGIYYPFANGQAQAFGAVERVEVLKGPQGTLFGRNSTGGAINIITKSPGIEPEASAQLIKSRFDTLKQRYYLSYPVGDMLASSVSYVRSTADQYYKGTRGDGNGGTTGFPQENTDGYRYKLRFSPTDNIDLNLAYIDYQQYGLGSTVMPNTAPSLLAQALQVEAETRDYHANVDVASYFSLDNQVLYGQFEWRLPWFDLKLLASDQDISTDNVYDQDGSDAPFITFDAKGQFADVTTQEIQLVSNDSAPDWLEWIVGAYHLEQESGFPLNRLSLASLDISDNELYGIPLPSQLIDVLADFGVPDGLSVGLVSLLGTESTAYFAQSTVHLNDSFSLTLGGRYQEERRYVIESSIGAVNLDGSRTDALFFSTPEKETSNFSPKVSLAYNPADDLMIYGSYTIGFKSGTFNTTNIYDEPEYVDPEEVTSIELGVKSQWLDRSLTLNGALFENTIDDLQVQFVSLISGGAVSLENAGSAQIRGAEVDSQWLPAPERNPGLVITLSAAYLDSEYTDYKNASGFDETTGLYNMGFGDFTGNRVVRTPEWTTNLGANQVVALGDTGELEFAASAYYSSGLYFLAQNSSVSYQESYTVVDASVSFLHYASNIRATVFGKNMTDEHYATSQIHGDAGRVEYLAPPPVYGIRLNWELM